MSAVYLAGSRSLKRSVWIPQVVHAVISSDRQMHVGCAIGADQAVIRAALSAPAGPSSLLVYAAFAQSGRGAWAGSAVETVQAAAAAGAAVHWLAGGDLSLPLRARLIRRSRAALAGCSDAVFFLATTRAPGSLAVAALAVSSWIPLHAFCFSRPLPPRGCFGRWLPGKFTGLPCWRWHPAQGSLF